MTRLPAESKSDEPPGSSVPFYNSLGIDCSDFFQDTATDPGARARCLKCVDCRRLRA
jgi:hypothetical protein